MEKIDKSQIKKSTLRALREVHGVSQEELAKNLGKNPRTIIRWESEGKLPSLDPEQWTKLYDLFNLDLSKFPKPFLKKS